MSQVTAPHSLTKFPAASFRELFFLALPLILSFSSASFMGFCDRLFLAQYSLEAWEGSVSAGYLCSLFQHPLVRIVAMTQVFVGLYCGSKKVEKIGAAVWQMIWLSLLSMLVTIPCSQFVAPFFFEGTSIRDFATPYFHTMMMVNFLFPLGTALSAFFIGQGRMRIILLTTLFSHGLNIGLDYIFIFGLQGYFPSLGITGAALATGISQFLYCSILFLGFLGKKERETFGTHNYRLDWNNFWGQLRIGLPRGIARIIVLTAWVSISRIMTLKGGDYLVVLSVGGTLILLFTFIHEGMLQGMITVASNLMGAKEHKKIWKLVRSGVVLVGLTSLLLAIPYLIMPDFTLSFFFSEKPSPETYAILKKSCIWLWVFFLCHGFHLIGLSLITAARDVAFFTLTITFTWITSYLPVYLAMNVFGFSPDNLWLIMASEAILFGIIFLKRATKEKWRDRESDLEFGDISN